MKKKPKTSSLNPGGLRSRPTTDKPQAPSPHVPAKQRLVNRTQFTSTLRNDLMVYIQELSLETDIPMTRLFDRAVEDYKEKRERNDL